MCLLKNGLAAATQVPMEIDSQPTHAPIRPFAVVDELAAGSPASAAGLQVN